jgi:hypothetical protein
MLETLALELAGQLSSLPPEEEGAEARAARILLELTPFGTCRNCGGLFAMFSCNSLFCVVFAYL